MKKNVSNMLLFLFCEVGKESRVEKEANRKKRSTQGGKSSLSKIVGYLWPLKYIFGVGKPVVF